MADLRAFYRLRQSLRTNEQTGEAPDDVQNGQVAGALRLLGIRHILARSPETRGRSERATSGHL